MTNSKAIVVFLLFVEAIIVINGIIGGRPTLPGEYAFIASFWNDTEHICGGSIISEQHILTAAHCVYLDDVNFRESPLKIVVGTNDLNEVNATNRVITDVEKIYVSVRYNHSYWSHIMPYDDIAVLKLKDKLDVKGNPEISIINLPEKNTRDTYENVAGVLVGFGYTYVRVATLDNCTRVEYGNSTKKLMQASLRVISNLDCQCRVGAKMMCAKITEHHDGVMAQGACNGDSGGPLIYNDTVIGFVSASSYGCNDNNDAGRYTRVTSYLDFIDNAVNDQPQNGMRVVTYDDNFLDGMRIDNY